MTKVTIIGEEQPKEKKGRKRKIQFVSCLSDKLNVKIINGGRAKPNQWSNVVLISRLYDGKNDLMYAYETNSITYEGCSDGCLFIGHFNDGIV